MSRIYFASPTEETELRGSERAHMGIAIDNIWTALITPFWDTEHEPSPLRRIVPSAPQIAPARPKERGDFDEASFWKPSSLFGTREFVLPDGQRIEFFEAALNTAMLFGPVMTVFAWLHGGCEIHAYVEGEDRAWLADVIEQGRAAKIMRDNMGWEDVVSLLRKSDDGPVVTSYSVTDGFPNYHVAGWKYDDRNRARWDNLSLEEQWRKAVKGLRSGRFGPRMAPNGSWFGTNTKQPWHAFNLEALAWSLGEGENQT